MLSFLYDFMGHEDCEYCRKKMRVIHFSAIPGSHNIHTGKK